MCVNFLAATDAPVVKVIDGQEVSFPVWTMGEVAAMAAKLAARRLEAATKTADEAQLAALDRAMYLGQLQIAQATPWDVARYFDTIEGSQECLEHSLKKSGWSDIEARAIVGRLYPVDAVVLARLVGRIVQPALPKGAQNPPETTEPPQTGS